MDDYLTWFTVYARLQLPKKVMFAATFDTVNTFKAYLECLTRRAEGNIASIIPGRRSVCLGVWWTNNTQGSLLHRVFVVSFCMQNGISYTMFSVLSPLEDEEHYCDVSHAEFLSFLWSIYNNRMENLMCIVGDNCSGNQSISIILSTPLIGCTRHRLQLSVNPILQEYSAVIEQVHHIMITLRTSLLSAMLRRYTPLKPRLRNATRLSLTYNMVKRHT